MADGQVEFELVTAEQLLLSKAVDMVVVPGVEGDFGVLPRHAPMISTIRPGVVKVYENGSVTDSVFIGGGFAEVTPERCTVLADEAVAVEDIDRSRAERRLSEARDDAADAKTDAERKAAEREIAIAEAMLRVSG